MSVIGDNSGAFQMQEIAKDAIEEALRPLWARYRTLDASFDRVPADIDENEAKKITDLSAMFGAVLSRLDQAHETTKLPYLEAGRVVDGKANELREKIGERVGALAAKSKAFLDAKQKAIDDARAAEREAEAADPEPGWTPPTRKAAVRGDFGAKTHLRDVKIVVIDDVKKVPKSVLEHPDVRKAIMKVAKPLLQANQKVGGCRLIRDTAAVTKK